MSRITPNKAFTLIELLVVVAIIALLTSILLPGLSSAKELARSVSCKSNLKNMNLAVHMYTCTWEFYPPAWVIGDPVSIAWCGGYYNQKGISCMDVTKGPLWPYLEQKKMLACPSFSTSAVKYTGSGQISGYGINNQYVAGDPIVNLNDGASGMTSYARPATTSQIKRPAETVLFGDCARVKQGLQTEEIYVYPLYKHGSATKNYATFHFRHQDQANAGFCDGHADSILPVQLDPAGDGKCGWMANEVMDRD